MLPGPSQMDTPSITPQLQFTDCKDGSEYLGPVCLTRRSFPCQTRAQYTCAAVFCIHNLHQGSHLWQSSGAHQQRLLRIDV